MMPIMDRKNRIECSAYSDPENILKCLKMLLYQRKNVAEQITVEFDENKLKVLNGYFDYTGEHIKNIIGLL